MGRRGNVLPPPVPTIEYTMAQPRPIHKVDLVKGVAVQICTGCLAISGKLVAAWRAEYPLANPAKFKRQGKNGALRSTKYCPECRRQLLAVARELTLDPRTVHHAVGAFLEEWDSQALPQDRSG
jgi:hypothetical protein